MKIKAVKQKTLSIQLKYKPQKLRYNIYFIFFFQMENTKFIEKDVKKSKME